MWDISFGRMLLHGFLHAFTGKSKYPLVKCKHIQPIWIVLYILTTQGVVQTAKFEDYKAVFSNPCTGIMTLNSSVPSLKKFTLCTYIKLKSSDPWTAFTYKLPSSPRNAYEIGLLGDNSSLKIWMFGTQITVLKSLSLENWHGVCIKWNSQTENMTFYINGTLEEERKLENYTELQGNGSVVLGCSKFDEANSTTLVGLVGELYMFRMWKTDESNALQKCNGGNVIKWDMRDWSYSPDVVQQDSSLSCESITSSVISPTVQPTGSYSTGQTAQRLTTASELNNRSVNNILLTSLETTNVSNVSSSSITMVNTNVSTDYNHTTTIIDVSSSSITTVNTNFTTFYDNTIIVTDGSNISTTDFNVTVTTDYINTTIGNMSCMYNVSVEVPNWYTDICNSSFTCNGTVYEIILQGNCTVAINDSSAKPLFQDYLIYNLSDGCRILTNNSAFICQAEVFLKPFNLSVQARNVIDYCCCEECKQPDCFSNKTVTCQGSSIGTTGHSGSIISTSDKNHGSSTTSNNAITTVNIKPSTTNNNVAKTTVWSSGSVSTTSTDSHTTINSGTTSIINSSSTTTFNSRSTTTVNITMSTSVNSMPTTSLSSEHSTPPKGTGFTKNDTTSPEFSTSSSSTNQSDALDKIVADLEGRLAKEVNVTEAENMLGILDSILNTAQNISADMSSRLINIVDKIGLKLNFPGQSVNLTSQYLALAVNKVNASSFNETSFGVESSSGLQVSLGSQMPENSDGSVLLPASLLNKLSPADKDAASRVQFNYYAKTSFFVDSSLTENMSLVSNVISSSVANLTISNLNENVTVTLKTLPHNVLGVLKCVFWDMTKNNKNGGWSSEGCTVDTTSSNNNQTVCKCNHLTSFGILLDMTPNNPVSPEDKLILTFITYIGCGLSAIFVSVTLVTYIAFEKIRRDYPSKILIQLCAALIGLNLTFLMDPWIAMYAEIPGLCISVAAFLHYFVLVTITWMGLEAFHMYLSLVKVFNTYVRKYMLKFCIIGWGAPAVVVAIILAVNKDLYELQITAPYPNGAGDYFCWMQPIIYWITVVGYFCVIFLLNVSMFVVVLIQLCRIKKQKQLGYQRKTFIQDVRSVAGITFLLGITWGLGFFTFGPGKTVIQYLFAIFNSLQGFFIFYFYCVAKENVRKQWRRYLCCGKFRLAENSDWSKTATNKLKKQTSKQGISSSSSNSIQSTSNSNSTTVLVSNEYAMHPNGNGNVFKERNGVSFMVQNGEFQLQEFPGRPHTRNGDIQRTTLRRTSYRGSVHFVDQI